MARGRTKDRTKDVVPLADRIAKARREGRTQQALELAKELAKQEPAAAHRELVRAVSFERGCQLLKDGKPRDAITVFKNAIEGETPDSFRAQVAAQLAEAGDIAAALELFKTLPDSPERAKAFTRAVDAALITGAKDALPPDLHAAFDAVRTAFDLVEKGQDGAAREVLQAIGLSSPFLEWKVMLRGLMAYYQNDDVRAQDNWQRLDPDRQPWRLVVPYRFQIDRAFREAQTPPAQERLRTLAARLGGNTLVAALRGLARSFATWHDDREAKNAQRSIRDFVQLYKPTNPALIARLGQLVTAKIITNGAPQDVAFFQQTFGTPADDPQLNRMMAVLTETNDDPDRSVRAWLAYEKDIAKLPDRFPGDLGLLARALVFEHIVKAVEVFEIGTVPAWVPATADLCKKSAELVPSRVEPHLLLVKLLQRRPKMKRETLSAAKELVKKFPDHVPTWELLAEASLSAKQYPSAIEAYRNILRIDPLRPGVRAQLAEALWTQGAKSMASKKPSAAKFRPLFEESLRLDESSLAAKLVLWSVFEAGLGHDEEAKRLREQALNRPQHRVAVPLGLHVLALASKTSTKAEKDETRARWLEAMQRKPTPEETIAALESLSFIGGPRLKGRVGLINALFPKTSDKWLEAFSADQLLHLGELFLDLDHRPSANRVSRHGEARFPKDPLFVLLEFDATDASQGYKPYTLHTMNDLLERARKLAEKLPREAQERVFSEIKEREDELAAMDLRSGRSPMEDMFGRFLDGFMDDFDDEWEEDEPD